MNRPKKLLLTTLTVMAMSCAPPKKPDAPKPNQHEANPGSNDPQSWCSQCSVYSCHNTYKKALGGPGPVRSMGQVQLGPL